ncbi:MAG: HAD family hydrolase [Elusimicrobia bacterium]|nr:HAD family hydrolase [Elusimicrobiota bacterium]
MRAWPPKVRKGPAVPTAFLDRDGTLNRDRAGTYITRPSQLKLYAGAAAALKLISAKGYRIVVLTNQSGVARGYMTLAASRAINLELVRGLRREGARIDAVYFCPHGPDGNCPCRKPSAGLIKEAAGDRPADMPRSFMAGDKDCDLLLARNAGLRGFLVLTGQGRSASAGAPAYRDLLALARALPDLAGKAAGPALRVTTQFPRGVRVGRGFAPRTPEDGNPCVGFPPPGGAPPSARGSRNKTPATPPLPGQLQPKRKRP